MPSNWARSTCFWAILPDNVLYFQNNGSACPENRLLNSLNIVPGYARPQHWEAAEGAASYAAPEIDTCACQSLCEPHRS
jgi:hypothetical protein